MRGGKIDADTCRIVHYEYFCILLLPNCNLPIVDGDTFECNAEGREEKVRLIGVDTPESKRNEKAKRDAEESGQDLESIVAMGKEAAEFAESNLKLGTEIKLELDTQPGDRYGRTLAYAYLPGGEMFNAILIKEGYAKASTYPPNVRYQKLFAELQREAREGGKGLWGR